MFSIAMWKHLKAVFTLMVAIVAIAILSPPAYAVPSFGRQTGMACAACHTVIPELTAFGRQFKLRGYTLGNQLDDKAFPANLPLSASLIASRTDVNNTQGSDPTTDFERNNEVILQTAAVYYGGKITSKSGAFAQYNYDGIERKWAIEMVDVRYADATTIHEKELLYGVTLNNGPTLQDVWNSAPMWSFPHLPDAGVMPPIATVLDMSLAQKAGGLGVYGFWDNTLYAEFSFYHTARQGLLEPLGAGVTTDLVVHGYAPYWHLMFNREMGAHNVASGIHGMTTDIQLDANDPGSPTDRYRDLSYDAQYQYVGLTHIFTTDALWIRERINWDASFPAGMASNPADVLHTFKMNVHYWYQRRVGGGIGYFSTWGGSDMMKYAMSTAPSAMGNATGSPDSRGRIVEVNYLPLKDVQNLKLGLRRTWFGKFNGARSNYNGFGRDAADNNTTFLYGQLLF